MPVYAYPHDIVFNACFWFRFITTRVLTWFWIYYWFSDHHLYYWSLHVLACLNHITLIMYTCAYLCTPLGFILCTSWIVFWQSWTFISRFWCAAKAWWNSSVKTLDFFEEYQINHSSFLTSFPGPSRDIFFCSQWVSFSLFHTLWSVSYTHLTLPTIYSV